MLPLTTSSRCVAFLFFLFSAFILIPFFRAFLISVYLSVSGFSLSHLSLSLSLARSLSLSLLLGQVARNEVVENSNPSRLDQATLEPGAVLDRSFARTGVNDVGDHPISTQYLLNKHRSLTEGQLEQVISRVRTPIYENLVEAVAHCFKLKEGKSDSYYNPNWTVFTSEQLERLQKLVSSLAANSDFVEVRTHILRMNALFFLKLWNVLSSFSIPAHQHYYTIPCWFFPCPRPLALPPSGSVVALDAGGLDGAGCAAALQSLPTRVRVRPHSAPCLQWNQGRCAL